jgi:hypothetical protein
MTSTTGRVTLAFATATDAARAEAALRPDNDGHLAARVDGTALVLEATSSSAMGLLRTLDDALACLRATGLD